MGKVAIVGSGLIGRCWSAMFARANHDVFLFDIDASQAQQALDDIRSNTLSMLDEFGMLHGETSVSEVADRIQIAETLEDALRDAIWVQECVPENLDLKKRVLSDIDTALTAVGNASVIIASSSSNLVPSLIASHISHKARVIVAHPVNPPFAIPLIELVPAPFTADGVITRARELMLQLGQKPITLRKEVDGFVLNRLQYALLAEAYRLVADGVCSAEDVDTAVSDGLGMRWAFMGPFQTIDLNAPGGVSDYCARYQDPILRVVRSQDNTVEWNKAVTDEIDSAMRRQYSRDEMAQRTEWRNNRLMNLAQHKRTMDEQDRASAPDDDA